MRCPSRLQPLCLLIAALGVTACGPPRPQIDTLENDSLDEVGQPSCSGTLLIKHHYISCHDDDWLIPRWVGYAVTAADLDGSASRTDDFRPDEALPAGNRAELGDYSGSGYDRGHMAPAGDFTRSSSAMSETFLLSNIAPQHAGMNRGTWKSLETEVRTETRVNGAAWIFTGNLMGDSADASPSTRIGSNGVAVPSVCFKALLLQDETGAVEAHAAVVANDPAPERWNDGLLSVDELESLTGLDFFANLPDDAEDLIEADVMGL